MTFDRATAIVRSDLNRFVADVREEWFGGAGPSGGYLAAILLRALMSVAGESVRPPRALHCQFFRAAGVGEVEVEVVERKRGRRVDFYGATLRWEGKVCIEASSVFAAAGDGSLDYCDVKIPSVKGWTMSSVGPRLPSDPPIFQQLEMRPAIGPSVDSGKQESLGGGWIRFREPRANDALALCLFLDAWLPSPTARLQRMPLAPTVEYSVLFRHSAPEQHDGPVLLRVESKCASEGYFDEDSVIWSPTGVLLAQGRQFAVLS